MKATMEWRSGFCGLDMPKDSHQRCRVTAGDMTCCCDCHQNHEPSAVEAVLEQIVALRGDADDLLKLDVSDHSWDDAVRALHEVEMARKSLQDTEDALKQRIGDAWPGRWNEPQVVDGVGQVKVFRGRERKKWDHDGLVSAVVKAHLENNGGEIPGPFEAARWIKEAAGFSYWKSSALKPLGIDPDDFCDVTRGRVGVQITSNDTIGGTE